MSLSPKMLESLERLLHLPPHHAFLGLALGKVEGDAITTELPYRDEHVGDIDTGAMHGGVLTSMLDATCGLAVMIKLGKLIRVTTLDLRIDHLMPITGKTTLRSLCTCDTLTDDVAFVTGRAYQLDAEGLEVEVAKASGSFLIVRARTGVQG